MKPGVPGWLLKQTRQRWACSEISKIHRQVKHSNKLKKYAYGANKVIKKIHTWDISVLIRGNQGTGLSLQRKEQEPGDSRAGGGWLLLITMQDFKPVKYLKQF